MQFWALIGPYLDLIWTLFGPYFDLILTLFWPYFDFILPLVGPYLGSILALQELTFSPQKMQLSPSPELRNWTFPPKNMQLSIVARPYFRNLTFPPKKCNCGKSGLQKLNFPPQKCNCPQVQTSGIELFPSFRLTNAIIKSGTSRLQNLNFSQTNEIERNWTFALKYGKQNSVLGKVQISNIEVFPPNNHVLYCIFDEALLHPYRKWWFTPENRA